MANIIVAIMPALKQNSVVNRLQVKTIHFEAFSVTVRQVAQFTFITTSLQSHSVKRDYNRLLKD